MEEALSLNQTYLRSHALHEWHIDLHPQTTLLKRFQLPARKQHFKDASFL